MQFTDINATLLIGLFNNLVRGLSYICLLQLLLLIIYALGCSIK